MEDDVWIGTDAIILSGIKIAKGTIIAAGSVVIKSTEPYSIIGGNPALLIKKRFDSDIINRLEKIQLDNISVEFIKSNLDFFYNTVDKSWFEKYNMD
ncbi:MAG: LbetaH domain-containing protein [Paludibacter sp.]